jgi:hypothetical protein
LGHIVIEHGNLVGDLGRLLARLNGKGDDVSAAQYAARNTFYENITAARALLTAKSIAPLYYAEFNDVLNEMERLNRARNQFIHSEYLTEVDQTDCVVCYYYRQIKHMGDLVDPKNDSSEVPLLRVSEKELRDLVSDMIALGRKTCVISEKYFDSLEHFPLVPCPGVSPPV